MIIAGRDRCIRCLTPLTVTGKCPKCNYEESTYRPGKGSLPPGCCLHERYFLGKVIGEGGFGITYIAWDIILAIPVALKEYLPDGLVSRETVRTHDTDVHIYEGNAKKEFEKGLKNFLKEARTLSQFLNLEGIVSVRDFFQENKTAYIVMEYIDGICISDYVRQQGKLSGEHVLDLMKPVLFALQEIHQTGLIHRDISADNLMLTHNGKLRLLDFGAARAAVLSPKTMTVSIKRGFSPEEQYRANGIQTASTDIYSVCATIYFMLTSCVPEESVERIICDRVVPLADMPEITLSEKQKTAIDRGMEILAENRWLSVSLLYQALYPDENPGKPLLVNLEKPEMSNEPSPNNISRTSIRRELSAMLEQNEHAGSKRRKWMIGIRITAVLLLIATACFWGGKFFLHRPESPVIQQNISVSTQNTHVSPPAVSAQEETEHKGSADSKTVKQVKIPRVTGMTYEKAADKLRSCHLIPKKRRKTSTQKKGVVIRQSKKAGKKAAWNTEIILSVSKGTAPVKTTHAPLPANTQKSDSNGAGKQKYSASLDDYLN